jgi:hypothetical protein
MAIAQTKPTDGTAGISIIIPCWKDFPAALEFGRRWSGHKLVRDVIIATAPGGAEAPPSMAVGGLTICRSERIGRGLQMNAGAAMARGDVLLFHHVDSYLADEHLHSLVECMRDPTIVGGAFYRKFDERHPGMIWAENIERWHSRTFGALYGDQSIFVRRDHFARMGGFAPIPLMEDIEFTLRLRRSGKIALLDPPMSSSPARQIAHGAWRTTGRNLLFLFLFRLGVPARFLHAWYYRHTQPPGTAGGNQQAHDLYGTEQLQQLKEITEHE